MKLTYTKILDDVDEGYFEEKYFNSIASDRKVEIVRQLITSPSQSAPIAISERLIQLDSWEMYLLLSIIWRREVPISYADLAEEVLLCLLSDGKSIKTKF